MAVFIGGPDEGFPVRLDPHVAVDSGGGVVRGGHGHIPRLAALLSRTPAASVSVHGGDASLQLRQRDGVFAAQLEHLQLEI